MLVNAVDPDTQQPISVNIPKFVLTHFQILMWVSVLACLAVLVIILLYGCGRLNYIEDMKTQSKTQPKEKMKEKMKEKEKLENDDEKMDKEIEKVNKSSAAE